MILEVVTNCPEKRSCDFHPARLIHAQHGIAVGSSQAAQGDTQVIQNGAVISLTTPNGSR
jgi:hypothetical protein